MSILNPNQQRAVDHGDGPLLIDAVPGSGKCVAPDTWVWSNGLRRLGELFGKSTSIATGFGPGRTVAWHDDGERDGVVVALHCGLTLDATKNHPVWTRRQDGYEGWVAAGKLETTDFVGVARGCAEWGTRDLPQDEAYLLGLFVADGYLSKTGKDLQIDKQRVVLEAVVPTVDRWCVAAGRKHGHTRIKDESANHAVLRACAPRIKEFVAERYGMKSAYSEQREFPAAVAEGTRDTVKAFLRGYFDGDGYCDKKSAAVSTASITLAEQVCLALIGLGVYCRLRHKKTPGLMAHIVEVRDLVAFECEVGFTRYGLKKDTQFDKLLEKKRNTNVDTVPHVSELLSSAPRCAAAPYGSKLKGRDNLLHHFHKVANGTRRPSYGALAQLAELLQDGAEKEELRRLMREHRAWSAVTSITDRKSRRIDCEVHDGHSFVGNGMVNHNTAVLTQRTAAIVARGADSGRVLLITFTNKAAGEMKERVGKIVNREHSKRIWAGTFHSICCRLLRAFEDDSYRDGRKKDFVIYDESDTLGCVKAACGELGLDPKTDKPSMFRETISKMKARGMVWQDVHTNGDEQEEAGKRVWQRYETILLHNNAFDFDDLLNVVMRRAEAKDEVGISLRSRWTHVLVDEFQDTNDVQARLVKAFASSTRNVTAVGDRFQSVYNFRGANPAHIQNFASTTYPDATVIRLSDNYRSTKNIVACFNSLLEGTHAVTGNDLGDKVAIRGFPDGDDEAKFVVASIASRIAKGANPAECVVIYRVHALSRAVEEWLRKYGIRYEVVGGMGFYDRKVVKDTIAYMRLIANPDSDLDFERVINEPARGLGEKAVHKIREAARGSGKSLAAGMLDALSAGIVTGKAETGLRNFFFLQKQAKELLADGAPAGVSRMVNFVLTASGYREALKAKRLKYESERKAAEAEKVVQDEYNAEQVVAAAAAYEQRVDKPSLQGFLDEVALISAQDELKGEKVKLMTCHASKGLEMDHVWGVGFEHGLLPFAMAITDEEKEEEARIAYVLCSRARKTLTLTYAEERIMHGKTNQTGPSELLDRIPDECSYWPERDQRKAAIVYGR